METIAGEQFLDEEDVARIFGKKKSSLRSDAARRCGPPRISVGNRILYRASAVRDYLKKCEVDFDALRESVLTDDAARKPRR
jgi:hypothetical protein